MSNNKMIVNQYNYKSKNKYREYENKFKKFKKFKPFQSDDDDDYNSFLDIFNVDHNDLKINKIIGQLIIPYES